ncbi:hypothetical protein [Actinomyces sp. Z16]|uniref:hypothetical protein n=2 Tax=Actinomyces TaxID=1654 RepID=UPI00131F3902|nr:hypothetical protein [Actinomyces sp. Z16]
MLLSGWFVFVVTGDVMKFSRVAVLLLGAAILAGCSGPDLSGDAEEIAKNVQRRVPSAKTAIVQSEGDHDYLMYQPLMQEGVRSIVVVYDSQYECFNDLDDEDRCRVGIEEFDTEEHAKERGDYLEGFSSVNPPNIIVPHVLGRYVVWFQDEMPEDVRQDYLDALG